jgi:hypothetical protein
MAGASGVEAVVRSVAVGSLAAERPPAGGQALEPWDAGGEEIVLRVSGGKPLHIRGRLLGQGSSRAPHAAAWHEIAFYALGDGRIALSLVACNKAAGATDVHRAGIFDSLDQAAQFLEQFDPAADLGAAIDASDPDISAVSIALQAAALRQRVDALTRQYDALIGELLYAMDTAD